MCKQEVGKDTGGDRLHACEVTRQLVRSCYKVSINSRDRLFEPFPTTEALVQSSVWPGVGRWTDRRESWPCRQTAPRRSFMRVVIWWPVWSLLAHSRSKHRMRYTTFRRFGIGRGPFTYGNILIFRVDTPWMTGRDNPIGWGSHYWRLLQVALYQKHELNKSPNGLA